MSIERPDWWHKNYKFWPVKTVDGQWTRGEVFRRKTDSGWEYQACYEPDMQPRETW
jgi:hypothetical protein